MTRTEHRTGLDGHTAALIVAAPQRPSSRRQASALPFEVNR